MPSEVAVVARPAAGQRVELPVKCFDSVHDVSADGSRLLLDDLEGSLEVWNLDVANLADLLKAKPISEFAPDRVSTHSSNAQFAPDGKTVFSTGGDGRLHQWDVESGDQSSPTAPLTAGLRPTRLVSCSCPRRRARPRCSSTPRCAAEIAAVDNQRPRLEDHPQRRL